MHYIILTLFSLMTILTPLQGDYFEANLPENWTKEVEQLKENGRIFEIWSNNEERIVYVCSPLLEEEKEYTARDIIKAIKMLDDEFKIYEESDSEAIVGWNFEVENEKTEITLMRIMITSEASHFLSYTYVGNEPEKIDSDFWLNFIKEAKLTASTPTLSE